MNNCRKTPSSFAALPMLALLFLLPMAQVAEAQIPNGCGTPDVPGWLANGLDTIFVGACDRHDLCWGQCNGPDPPFLGLGHKLSCDAQFLAEMEAVCLAVSATLAYPVGEADNADEFLEICTEVAATFYAIVSANVPGYWTSQCKNGCNPDACATVGLSLPTACGAGLCYTDPPPPSSPPPPSCECFDDFDCQFLPPPEFGRWVCRFCECIETEYSPLVLHLPDYFSTRGENQNWWREGFCSPGGPTVCLDWSGNGEVVCNSWVALESDLAFVVSLSEVDIVRLVTGLPVRAEPWRHFFGNITMGPEGDFPYVHGFEALAAHCGLEPETTSEIDFAECGSSLYVWGDLDGDGDIEHNELLELGDLGVQSLGVVRQTGKQDRCGNLLPYEAHATCTGRNGKCGTWLDVFFVRR